MAAALLRGGAGLCVRCIHRELCRLVWRPQTASFSSKQSDRKQPRRTHIKKAKPQPAVDVAKLLEQLFSQRRPSTTPPAGKGQQSQSARPAQASTRTTGPPATSSTSRVPPVSPAASSVKPADVSTQTASPLNALTQPNLVPKPKQKPSVSYETTPGFIQSSATGGLFNVTVPTTATSAPRQTVTSHTSLESEMPAVEPQTPAETTETKVEAATEVVAHTAAPVLPKSANMIESNAKTSALPAATVERSIEPTSELESVIAKPSALETLEREACVVQGAVEPLIEAAADTTAQAVRTNSSELGGDDLSRTATVEPTVDTSTVEASASPVETPETGTAVAEGTIEPASEAAAEVVSANGIDSGADGLPSSALVENTEESGAVPLMNKVESTEESSFSSSETVTAEEGVSEAEAMTLESVTLAEAKATVESLQTDDLLQTTSALNEKAEKLFQDSRVQMESGNELSAAAETEKVDEAEAESLTQVLSIKDSLPEDVEALKAETDILMEELLCSAPDLPSRVQNTEAYKAAASSSPVGANGDSAQVEKVEAAEEEAMTLESITLAEVTAGVGTLETGALQATRTALEKEVEMVETMEVKTSMEDSRVHEETKEAEIVTLDSLTEAADALEAETSIVLEAMFCSEPQPRLLLDPLPDGQQLGPQEVTLGREADVESKRQGGSILEAMTLESITLAEVEAGVGALETEVLQEMRTALEKEAEMVAKEENMEVKTAIEEGTVSEETKEAEIFTLDSLAEAADALEAETSVVLEAMFCSDPQPKHPQDPYLDGQKLGPEVISQEGDVASRGQEGGVLEAMTLDSVTLAEVEASLGGSENESLSETTAHLEKEAEALAQEEKVEVYSDASFEEMNEALTVESLSPSETGPLPEALQTEAQVEELLFSIPGHVAVVSKAVVDQEAVKDNVQDGELIRETPVSDEAMFQTKGGEEEVVVHEALTLESLMISAVNPLMETLEMDGLAETETETGAETQMEEISFGEAAEPNVLTEEEMLTKAEVLLEAVDALEEESVLVQQTLTCPVSGTTATITTGSAAGGAAGTETDAPPGYPAAEDIRPGQEEEGTQTGAAETLDSTGTQTDLDPVQRLFLEKIREYNEHREHGGTLEVEQDFERLVSEETAKLQRLYGGGDLSSFPQFTFSEPKLDQDSK